MFHPVIDREISKADMDDLPLHTVSLIEHYAEHFLERNVFRLSGDGDRYMNHSDNPNIEDRGYETFAIRDIQPGEELFADYRISKVLAFDPDLMDMSNLAPTVTGG